MAENTNEEMEQGGSPLEPRVERMVNEYSELVIRMNALDEFVKSHEPSDEDIDEEEWPWLIEQLMCMSCYALALEQRIAIQGYDVRIVTSPEEMAMLEQMTQEAQEAEEE